MNDTLECLYGDYASVFIDAEGEIFLSVSDDGNVYLAPHQAIALADALRDAASKAEEAAK